MARAENKRITLSMPEEMIEMLKDDARAIGMTPSSYVAMLIGVMNKNANTQSSALGDLADALTATITKNLKTSGYVE